MRAAANEDPRAAALVEAAGVLSYAEVDERVDAIARSLRKRGVRRGYRVAVLAPPRTEVVLLLLALWRSGVTACPVSTRFPADLRRDYIRRIAPVAFIVPSDAQWADDTSWSLEDIMRGARSSSHAEPTDIEAERAATIVATSGSTGDPSPAVISYGSQWHSALGSNRNIRVDQGDRWLLNLPLYHVSGLGIVMRCVAARACLAVPRSENTVAESVEQFGASHISVVPTQLRRLLSDRSAVHPTLRAVLLGGAAAPEGLLRAAVSAGYPLHTSYGLTEMCSQVTATPPGAALETLRTSGRVLPHRELAISEEGEILVRGATLFLGYLEPEGPRLPLDASGWFHTRDLGRTDSQGRLLVLGRADNMFVSGGENVHPEAIERALMDLPEVDEAVVVPVFDPEYGYRPVAFLRWSSVAETRVDLASRLRERLPGFMVPLAFHEWTDVAGSGLKPSRRALASEAARLRGAAFDEGDTDRN